MGNTKKHWVSHPSKKVIILFAIAWFVGNGLLILSLTDLFRAKFQPSPALSAIMMGSTVALVKLYANYAKNRESI